ncbi:hypothetical protein C8R44DRAFT_845784 [Mycena epipterygia]|nr:hypothetical protein C8R44DRAFT_845784 [Mycena epipterygia]
MILAGQKSRTMELQCLPTRSTAAIAKATATREGMKAQRETVEVHVAGARGCCTLREESRAHTAHLQQTAVDHSGHKVQEGRQRETARARRAWHCCQATGVHTPPSRDARTVTMGADCARTSLGESLERRSSKIGFVGVSKDKSVMAERLQLRLMTATLLPTHNILVAYLQDKQPGRPASRRFTRFQDAPLGAADLIQTWKQIRAFKRGRHGIQHFRQASINAHRGDAVVLERIAMRRPHTPSVLLPMGRTEILRDQRQIAFKFDIEENTAVSSYVN